MSNKFNYRYSYNSRYSRRKKQNNKWLIILICALLVVNIAIFGFIYFFKKGDSTGVKTNSTDPSNDSTISTQAGKDNQTSSSSSNTSSDNQQNNSANTNSSAAMISDFVVLSQGDELPTGCEITSLTMTMNFYGVPADKFDLADNYLKKGEVGSTDFRKAFVGDPRDASSYGCYAPVIVDAANNYFSKNSYSMSAVDKTGTDFSTICEYIDSQTPVIIWGTRDCQQPQYTTTWEVDGEQLTWIYPEHCMVLVGYNDQYVWAADPIYGYSVAYDRDTFESRYNFLGKQAVILSK